MKMSFNKLTLTNFRVIKQNLTGQAKPFTFLTYQNKALSLRYISDINTNTFRYDHKKEAVNTLNLLNTASYGNQSTFNLTNSFQIECTNLGCQLI